MAIPIAIGAPHSARPACGSEQGAPPAAARQTRGVAAALVTLVMIGTGSLDLAKV